MSVVSEEETVSKKGTVLPKSNEYETPHNVYRKICMYFGLEPTLDVCATERNKKCEIFYTKEDDALIQDWSGHTVWCNPPHSKITEFVKKADRESPRGNRIVMLLPALIIGTKYWNIYIHNKNVYWNTTINTIGESRPKFLIDGIPQKNPRNNYIVVVWNK